MQVIKNIFLFGGFSKESNIYVVDGEVMVDTGSGEVFNEIKKDIQYSVPNHMLINKIINTHCHYDHTGGNKKMRDWLNAEIFIHSADKKAMENGKTMAELFNSQSKAITIDSLLGNGDRIKTKNFEFEVLHTPGHTPGSICLYDKQKEILISGDTIFRDGIGRTDLPGGDIDALYRSLKNLSKYKIKYLLPGHGAPQVGGVNLLIKQLMSSRQFHEFY